MTSTAKENKNPKKEKLYRRIYKVFTSVGVVYAEVKSNIFFSISVGKEFLAREYSTPPFDIEFIKPIKSKMFNSTPKPNKSHELKIITSKYDIEKITSDLKGTTYTIKGYLEEKRIDVSLEKQIYDELVQRREINYCDGCGAWDEVGEMKGDYCEACAGDEDGID